MMNARSRVSTIRGNPIISIFHNRARCEWTIEERTFHKSALNVILLAFWLFCVKRREKRSALVRSVSLPLFVKSIRGISFVADKKIIQAKRTSKKETGSELTCLTDQRPRLWVPLIVQFSPNSNPNNLLIPHKYGCTSKKNKPIDNPVMNNCNFTICMHMWCNRSMLYILYA